MQSEPGDPFNHFWNIMQGMLDTLSSPVAFATAPLGNPESVENTSANGSGIHSNSRTPSGSGSLGKKSSFLGGDTEADEPIFTRLGRKFGVGRESSGVKQWNTGKGLEENSSLDEDEDFDDGLFDDGMCVPILIPCALLL